MFSIITANCRRRAKILLGPRQPFGSPVIFSKLKCTGTGHKFFRQWFIHAQHHKVSDYTPQNYKRLTDSHGRKITATGQLSYDKKFIDFIECLKNFQGLRLRNQQNIVFKWNHILIPEEFDLFYYCPVIRMASTFLYIASFK